MGHLLRQLRSGLDGAELKRRYNVQEMETSWYGDLEGSEELEGGAPALLVSAVGAEGGVALPLSK